MKCKNILVYELLIKNRNNHAFKMFMKCIMSLCKYITAKIDFACC